MDEKELKALDAQIAEFHIQKVTGKITEREVIGKIRALIKKEDKEVLAALIYFKSLAHGHHTAVSMPVAGFPEPHIIGFLYNMSWDFKLENGTWLFKLSKDPFTHIKDIPDLEDARVFTAQNEHKGEMDIATADYIMQKVFKAVLDIVEEQWEREALMQQSKRGQKT